MCFLYHPHQSAEVFVKWKFPGCPWEFFVSDRLLGGQSLDIYIVPRVPNDCYGGVLALERMKWANVTSSWKDPPSGLLRNVKDGCAGWTLHKSGHGRPGIVWYVIHVVHLLSRSTADLDPLRAFPFFLSLVLPAFLPVLSHTAAFQWIPSLIEGPRTGFCHLWSGNLTGQVIGDCFCFLPSRVPQLCSWDGGPGRAPLWLRS